MPSESKRVITLLFFFGFNILTCQFAMMVVFMAGVEAAPQLAPWLYLQLAAILLAILTMTADFVAMRRRSSWRTGLQTWWHALPQWMLLAFVILALVMIVGELSFFLLFKLTGQIDPWKEHIPIISMVASSLAFMTIYCERRAANGNVAKISGRWR